MWSPRAAQGTYHKASKKFPKPVNLVNGYYGEAVLTPELDIKPKVRWSDTKVLIKSSTISVYPNWVGT